MIDLIVFVTLLALGYGFGRMAETGHYRSIHRREKAFRNILLIAARFPPPDLVPRKTQLVAGSAVISVDYFKRFVAGLRNIFGGRVRSYESLLDRARREAILRMKSQARALGADMVFNIKLETASISKGRRNAIGAVEVLAYGTACVPQKHEA
ncbi:MAG: YbjQ family protein [Gammaproteobacteria bacterium]|nr:YbjQ family protein [Gammaproteobacteria bacterium]